MLELAERAGDRELALQARNWRIVDLLELGDAQAVRDELDAYAALAADVRPTRGRCRYGVPRLRCSKAEPPRAPGYRAAPATLGARLAMATPKCSSPSNNSYATSWKDDSPISTRRQQASRAPWPSAPDSRTGMACAPLHFRVAARRARGNRAGPPRLRRCVRRRIRQPSARRQLARCDRRRRPRRGRARRRTALGRGAQPPRTVRRPHDRQGPRRPARPARSPTC